jgi:branched-chain amino acid transport system permease protein
MTTRLPRTIPWMTIAFAAALFIPILGTRFYTSVATDVLILGLFATSLNLLLGTTGLVSFGHAAYFAIGAYVCAIAMKTFEVPFLLALPLAGLAAASAALVFGYFCVRLTKIYFAMLTLAFAQIVWAICFKWNDVTGGEQGFNNVPYPDLAWMEVLPALSSMRIGELYFYVTLVVVCLCLYVLRRITRSPFGRILTTIRENPPSAQSLSASTSGASSSRPSSLQGCLLVWRAHCSAFSTAVSFLTSATGPSPRKCSSW